MAQPDMREHLKFKKKNKYYYNNNSLTVAVEEISAVSCGALLKI